MNVATGVAPLQTPVIAGSEATNQSDTWRCRCEAEGRGSPVEITKPPAEARSDLGLHSRAVSMILPAEYHLPEGTPAVHSKLVEIDA
jgi:hypothetical protein